MLKRFKIAQFKVPDQECAIDMSKKTFVFTFCLSFLNGLYTLCAIIQVENEV